MSKIDLEQKERSKVQTEIYKTPDTPDRPRTGIGPSNAIGLTGCTSAQISTHQSAGICDRACGSCGRRQPGMIAMDGTPTWYLCGACSGTPTPRAVAWPQSAPAPTRGVQPRGTEQRVLGLAGSER
jgi:hypothetical protein